MCVCVNKSTCERASLGVRECGSVQCMCVCIDVYKCLKACIVCSSLYVCVCVYVFVCVCTFLARVHVIRV